MCVSNVEGVAEVHLEGVNVPMQAILYEGGGKLGTVQEVHCRDTDGMCAPLGDGGVILRNAVNGDGNGLEPLCVGRASDV
jgi:hypothetical protein